MNFLLEPALSLLFNFCQGRFPVNTPIVDITLRVMKPITRSVMCTIGARTDAQRFRYICYRTQSSRLAPVTQPRVTSLSNSTRHNGHCPHDAYHRPAAYSIPRLPMFRNRLAIR
jgi:hypothetical protein